MNRLKRKILVRIFATDLQYLWVIMWLLMLIIVIPILFRMGILRLRWDPSVQRPWFMQIAYVVIFLVGLIVFFIAGIALALGISHMAVKYFRSDFHVLYESFRRKVDLEKNKYKNEV